MDRATSVQKMLIGTHHKAGTVWMKNIFTEVAGRFGLLFHAAVDDPSPPSEPWDLFHNMHSHFQYSQIPNFRGLHLIRDPRDIIVSAAFYHVNAEESWLLMPRQEFGGLSYQQKIRSYAHFEDQILFEMEHASCSTLEEMARFDYHDDRFVNVKYEHLIQDGNLVLFRSIFGFLGFKRSEMRACLGIAKLHSLFSGQIISKHIRSGEPSQWPEYFTSLHRKRFQERFGNLIELLGYDQCQPFESIGGKL